MDQTLDTTMTSRVAIMNISPFKEILRSTYGGSYIRIYVPCAFQESPITDFFPALWFRVNSLSLLSKRFAIYSNGGTCYKCQIKILNEWITYWNIDCFKGKGALPSILAINQKQKQEDITMCHHTILCT